MPRGALHDAKTVEDVHRALQAGADVHAQDLKEWTALMYAAAKGERGEAMMRVLLSAGADPNKHSNNGRTALMLAAENGGEHGAGMTRLLLSAGADANKQSKGGMTALILAAFRGEHGAGMIRVLVDAGADTNKQSKDGMTALMFAAVCGGAHGEPMIRALLSAGADANKHKHNDDDGWTALMYAARFGGEHAEGMVRLLVAHGATLPPGTTLDPADTPAAVAAYVIGTQNWTPLHRAADARDFNALFVLLPRGGGAMHPDESVIQIASSDEYPCAAPVCPRCVELVSRGPVWSVANHALCPADERLAASARALMTGRGGIGPVARIFVPADVWRYKIFSFLIFEDGYRDNGL